MFKPINWIIDLLEIFIKNIRYFFKKNHGEVFFCPIKFGIKTVKKSWDPEQICNIAKNIKIKARAFDTFQNALFTAIEESNNKSLIVVTGSNEIISEYLNSKKT